MPVVFDLRLLEEGAPASGRPAPISVNGTWLSPRAREVFAQVDGFDTFGDMVRFWLAEHGPILFEGVCIRWRPAEEAA